MVDSLLAPLLAGNRLALARAITAVENERAEARPLLSALFPHTGRGHIIGITGAPGTGKSTLVTALAQSYRAAGLTVAIVAVDPTSPFTGGALLGDRVRMRALSGDAGVFMRSMASRGNLGGLSKTTDAVVTLLDAAGFARILVETVGVGQAEVEIASTAHTTLVVEAPGLGDEVQAIKAGILEIADLVVVNKADHAGVERTVQALEMMVEMGNGEAPRLLYHHGQLLQVTMPPVAEDAKRWRVPVLKTIAINDEGIKALRQQIEGHYQWLVDSGQLAAREEVRLARTLETLIYAEMTRQLRTRLPAARLQAMLEQVVQRKQDPYTLAAEFVREDGI